MPGILLAPANADLGADVARAAHPTGEQLPEWVMVARTGEWLGHPAQEERITADDLRAAHADLDARYTANGTRMVADWEHQSLTAMRRGDAAPAPAALWFDGFELRNNDTELWAHVERYTKEAMDALVARRYRYLSPVFTFNRPNPKTGEPQSLRLINVGLTNSPFMTELPALVNSLFGAEAHGGRGAAGGPDSQTATQGKESSMGLLAKIVALGIAANALGLQDGASDEDVLKAVADKLKGVVANAALETRLTGVANSLGLPEASAQEVVLAEIGRLKKPGLDPGRAAVANALGLAPDSPLETLTGAIGALQRHALDNRAERLVANAVEAGKIPPATKEWWTTRAQADFAGTEAVIGGLPVVLDPASNTDGPAPGAAANSLTAEEKAVAAQLGVAEKDLTEAKKA